MKAGRRLALLAAGAAAIASAAPAPSAAEPPVPALMQVTAGDYLSGSDRPEREAAYGLDEQAYGHSRTREQGWYENERERGTRRTGAFSITRTPITNRHYAAFIASTGHRAPDVDPATWESYGLIHPYPRTRRHAWSNALPPRGRLDHPVVLVSYADTEAYAAWLSRHTGQRWRLPTQDEWEKAVRGTDGRRFPWGNDFEPQRLNSHDGGPFDTVPVHEHPDGVGPFGLLDGAGQVFEWIAKPADARRAWVKGGSWDDSGCGVCRPAARHSRPVGLKHILIGFRLVRE